MKKVLIVTDVSFWEQCSGDRVRIYSLVNYLSHHVHLTVVNTGPVHGNIDFFLNKPFNIEFFILEKTKYLSSNGYGRRLKAFLERRKFDTIIIEYIHSSYFLNFLTQDTQVILDAHDIINERTEEFRKFNYPGNLYEITKESEVEIFKVYDAVITLCEPDHQKVTSVIGQGKSLLCPHPVLPTSKSLRNEVKNISFVASAYLPNKDAICFFIEHCWPQLSAKYNIELSIYGTVCNVLPFGIMNGIAFKGFVNDRDRIYEEADIIINPVRFGAGLKIKNVEALAHGIPLVTTSHGARGLENGINNAFLVADDPTDFITAISSLIEDYNLRKDLSEQSCNFIRDNFSPEMCFAPLMNFINQSVN